MVPKRRSWVGSDPPMPSTPTPAIHPPRVNLRPKNAEHIHTEHHHTRIPLRAPQGARLLRPASLLLTAQNPVLLPTSAGVLRGARGSLQGCSNSPAGGFSRVAFRPPFRVAFRGTPCARDPLPPRKAGFGSARFTGNVTVKQEAPDAGVNAFRRLIPTRERGSAVRARSPMLAVIASLDSLWPRESAAERARGPIARTAVVTRGCAP